MRCSSFFLVLVVLEVACAAVLRKPWPLRAKTNSSSKSGGGAAPRYKVVPLAKAEAPAETFQSYYGHVTAGRGIWKWNDALVAYDRHMLQFQGRHVVGAEVGVQSGGSLQMWKKVLGDRSEIHGIDINPLTADFADQRTSITIGDQQNPEVWKSFFEKVTPRLDFLIDDGGHLPEQMLETTRAVFPKLNSGGVLAIEDIHGAHYMQTLFHPIAEYLGSNKEVASLHLYPYLLVVQKRGSEQPLYDPTQLPGANIPASGKISDLPSVSKALAVAPPSSLIVIENPGWGHFINPSGLEYFFQTFIDLYQPKAMPDDPPGCATTSKPKCTSKTTNSEMMSKIYAVHILPNRAVIEVPSKPPVIEAVRHGTEWIEHDPLDKDLPEHLRKLTDGSSPAQHVQVVKPFRGFGFKR